MTEQCKETTAEFIIPNFDFVIVTSGNDEGFHEMKVDAADGTVVLFKSVDDCSHAVIPSVEAWM
jgi:hypothetical protein